MLTYGMSIMNHKQANIRFERLRRLSRLGVGWVE